MRGKIIGFAICAFVTTSLTGCNQSNVVSSTNKVVGSSQLSEQLNNKVANSNENSGDTFFIESSADWISASSSIQDLYNNSDLVMQIKIDNIEYYCGNGGLIYTKFIPQVVETYKGTYDEKYIVSIGGIVDYEEYLKHDVDPNNFKTFTDASGTKPTKVQLTFDNIYIVKTGEEYIIFCKEKNGIFTITNGNQGLFKVTANNIENKALKDSNDLINDIKLKINQKAKEINESGNSNNSIVEEFDKELFLDVLQDIKVSK
ncbi:MAG: hypothetical protein ABRQ27_06485 [Clostridiaceae bacterium]